MDKRSALLAVRSRAGKTGALPAFPAVAIADASDRYITSMIGAISTLKAGFVRIGQSLALATASSMSFASTIV